MSHGFRGVTLLHDSLRTPASLTWNAQTRKADELFEPLRKTHPRWAVEWAFNYMLEGLMEQSNSQRERVLERLHFADGLAKDLRDNPSFVRRLSGSGASLSRSANETLEVQSAHWARECDIAYAEAMLGRATYQLLMNSFIKAAINIRRAWVCYRTLLTEIEKEDVAPEHILSIRFGVGTFYLFLTLVPTHVMRILSVLGFVQNKKVGEKYLMQVMRRNSIRSPLAALILCTYYLFLPTGLGDVTRTLRKAKFVIVEMNRRYPKNIYFRGYANFYHRKRGNPKLALKAIQKATVFAKSAGYCPTLFEYMLGDTYMMDLQFEQALRVYEGVDALLKQKNETFSYSGELLLAMAACHIALGNDALAFELIEKVPIVFNTMSKQDAGSPKIAARILTERRMLPLLPVMMLYANRELAHMEPSNVDRLKKFNNKLLIGRDLSPPEVIGTKRLLDAVMDKNCGRIQPARKALEELLAEELLFNNTSMLKPSTYYELGELEYREGNIQRAKELLTIGSKIEGEGNPTISNRFKIAKKQLTTSMVTVES